MLRRIADGVSWCCLHAAAAALAQHAGPWLTQPDVHAKLGTVNHIQICSRHMVCGRFGQHSSGAKCRQGLAVSQFSMPFPLTSHQQSNVVGGVLDVAKKVVKLEVRVNCDGCLQLGGDGLRQEGGTSRG